MNYATAIWNYVTDEGALPTLINEFADFGYDTISFTTALLNRLDDQCLRDVAATVRARGLMVTVHGNFELSLEQVARCLEPFAYRLLCVTFDAALCPPPDQSRHDAARMAPLLRELLALTAGWGPRVAVEDFPLQRSVLEAYHAELAPLLDDPRYGILVDVGHMHIRLTQESYYAGVDVAEYLRRVPLPVVEVHLHDNQGVSDQHGYFGMGTVRFDLVAQALKHIGFAGVSTIEIAPRMHGADPDRSKHHAAAALRQWRELWEGAT